MRFRIRFRKEGDLRWIGHRDLARAWERMCHRADLPLAMSQGFHPHPRINFPSALAVGIQGTDELVELELNGDMSADQMRQRLTEQAPDGLTIQQVQPVPPQHPKPRVRQVTYQLDVPEDRRAALSAAIDALLQSSSCFVKRPGRETCVDLRAGLNDVRLQGNLLQFDVVVSQQASVRPREVLQALGIGDVERHGSLLVRTEVQLLS